MSGQASRRHALRHETERRQVALEVAKLELTADIVCANCTGTGIDFDVDCTAEGCANRPLGSPESGFTAHHAGPNCESTCTLCEGKGTGRAALALALLTDPRQGFDVHAAREHARTLIAKGLDLTTGPEHDVWTDWRAWWAGKGRTPDECPAAASGHGAQYARLGQRILDMLEGQPSECQSGSCLVFLACDGKPRPDCEDCHGTGHSPRGKLPEVEWSPAVRRKVADATAQLDHATRWDGECWVDTLVPDMPFGWGRLLQAMPGDRGPELHARWRVCPRGEHRRRFGTYVSHDCGMSVMMHRTRHGLELPELDARISQRTEYCGAGTVPREHLPAWRRGEIEHARQRREREARRGFIEIDTRRIMLTPPIREALLAMNGVDTVEIERNPTGSHLERAPSHSVRVSYTGSALPVDVGEVASRHVQAGDGLVIHADITLPGRVGSVQVFETFEIE